MAYFHGCDVVYSRCMLTDFVFSMLNDYVYSQILLFKTCWLICLFFPLCPLRFHSTISTQREFPKFFTFRARDKVGACVTKCASNHLSYVSDNCDIEKKINAESYNIQLIDFALVVESYKTMLWLEETFHPLFTPSQSVMCLSLRYPW